ncbi:hypothetical protein [Nocardia cyriacigeorgica]|uniref:hypothetical protein n=1 Tax=Nocardia cyriacigeorgica TaxID=135487 RepID=UPI0020172433|nr:hypothetical protein [Nocardia cyriacigeorgica]
MNLDPPDPEDTREPPRDNAEGVGNSSAEPADLASPDPGAELTGEAGGTSTSRSESAQVAAESAPGAGAAGERAADRRGERSGPPRVVTVAAVGALVIALAAAAWFGAGWVRAAFFTDGPRVAARDAALDAAQQAAINMTSMNIDDVPGSLALARSSMTGPILASATEHQQQAEAMAKQAGVRMESSVLGAALTSLNSELDRASALVVLRVTEAKPGERPAGYRYTWTLDMAKDGDIWKAEQVSSLGQPVPLNDAGTDPADPVEPGQPATPDGPSPGPASGEPGEPAESSAAPAPLESPDAPAQDSPGNAAGG